MSNQSPYEQLGVEVDSSFDEIQAARDRLRAQCDGDEKELASIEAAYDAVLMDRLKMRQEGRIKVPERIRFPERMAKPAPEPSSPPANQSPAWLQRWLDTPSRADIWMPAGVFAGLSALVVFAPASTLQFLLLVGVAVSFYFLYRKEQKAGRAILLAGLLGLIGGFLVAGVLWLTLMQLTPTLPVSQNQVTVLVTFLLLWLISSFLR